MKRVLWPLLTGIVFFSSLTLWFSISSITASLTSAVEMVFDDAPWATYDLDGRDLVVRGVAPDEVVKANLIEKISTISGIEHVHDEVILPPLNKPFVLVLTRNENGMFITGAFPVGFDRFSFLETIETTGTTIADGAGNARGADQRFTDWAFFAAKVFRELKMGRVHLSDAVMTVDGEVRDDKIFERVVRDNQPDGLTVKIIN